MTSDDKKLLAQRERYMHQQVITPREAAIMTGLSEIEVLRLIVENERASIHSGIPRITTYSIQSRTIIDTKTFIEAMKKKGILR